MSIAPVIYKGYGNTEICRYGINFCPPDTTREWAGLRRDEQMAQFGDVVVPAQSFQYAASFCFSRMFAFSPAANSVYGLFG